MATYIEREAVLAIYKKWLPQLEAKEDDGDRRGVETCIAVLEDEPAADVAPVVHGDWTVDGKNHCHCSSCGFGRNIETQIGWNYCPNCGAKMDGGKNDAAD